MDVIKLDELIKSVDVMADIIIENEVPFCELDSVAGDGDFGMSLAKGFKMIKKEWRNIPKENMGVFLKECGMIIMEHCGGASGPIWGTAFRSMGKYADENKEFNLSEFADLFQSAVDGIQKKGGAKLGDKTLLDALIPATESLKNSANSKEDMLDAMKKSAMEAVKGAEKTKEFVASKGRATYLGERSLNYPDAGATAIGIIFTGIIERVWQD